MVSHIQKHPCMPFQDKRGFKSKSASARIEAQQLDRVNRDKGISMWFGAIMTSIRAIPEVASFLGAGRWLHTSGFIQMGKFYNFPDYKKPATIL